MSHDDFDFESARGLPDKLPVGETLLWQGGPSWRAVATRVFHVDKVAIYFAAIIVWRFAASLNEGNGLWAATQSGAGLLPLAIAAVLILGLFAWGVGRTTVYSITNRRVVMRIGMALPLTVYVPLNEIVNADLKINGDKSGDLALATGSHVRIPYLVLWPHARAFHVTKPQPQLRCLAEPKRVGDILASALARSMVASRSVTTESAEAEWPKHLAAAE
jgi:Bacterial PH domain